MDGNYLNIEDDLINRNRFYKLYIDYKINIDA